MSQIERASRTVSVHTSTRITTHSAENAPSLLPTPTMTRDALTDATSDLYVLLSQRRSSQERFAAKEIDGTQRRIKDQIAREHAAATRERAHSSTSGRGFFGSIAKMAGDFVDDVVHGRMNQAFDHLAHNAEDAWNSPSFWKDLEKGALAVAKCAAVVGAVAASVVTFGAATPAAVVVIAGVAVSAAATIEGELHVLEKCGVDPDVASKIRLGVAIGGAVAGGVGGVMGAVGAASSAATATSTITKVATVTASAAPVVSGAAQMVAGGAHVKNGEFEAEAVHASADRKHEQNVKARLERLLVTMVEALKESDAQCERTLRTLTETMSIRSETLILSTARA